MQKKNTSLSLACKNLLEDGSTPTAVMKSILTGTPCERSTIGSSLLTEDVGRLIKDLQVNQPLEHLRLPRKQITLEAQRLYSKYSQVRFAGQLCRPSSVVLEHSTNEIPRVKLLKFRRKVTELS